MNILFINPPTLYRGFSNTRLNELDLRTPVMAYYEKLWLSDRNKKGFTTFPGEHLGLQSLKSNLLQHNHTVTILNACLESHTTLYETLSKIIPIDYDLIGFTGPQDVFAEICWLANEIRETGFTKYIALGHDFATLNHELILKKYPEFDFVIRGEGEQTIVALANCLESNGNLRNIDGLTFRVKNTGEIISNKPRTPIQNLDDLPWVDRGDIEKVKQLRFSPSIFTRRGCLYQCSFCTTGMVPIHETIRGREVWRKKSTSNVVDEMEYLSKKHRVSYLSIVDDLYLAKGKDGAEHALSIAEEMIRRNLSTQYMIDCRVDSIDFQTFDLLKKSGLNKVFIGVESGSENTLRHFRKGYRSSLIKEKLTILDTLGIEYVLGFIMFNPYETIDGLLQSINLLKELNLRDFELFLQSVRIYSGTQLHFALRQDNLIEGEFPFYQANYVNDDVAKIKDFMNKIGENSINILKSKMGKNVDFRDTVYTIILNAITEMINSAKTETDLSHVYENLMTEINRI